MPARLRALAEGPDILLGRSLLLVGRHPDCDVRLPSIRISRRHCCLIEVDGVVIVRDLGSSKETLINGRQVEEGRLRPGDELSIANLRYRLEPGRPDRACPVGSRPATRGDSATPAELPATRLGDDG
jgi:predicted component of type VI protein secretion system